MDAWKEARLPTSGVASLAPAELYAQMEAAEAPARLYVRFDYEWKLGHAPGAQLVQLPEAAAALPKDAPYAVVWAAGFRASTAASVLERVGFTDVAVPEGGGGA